jgi:hypothetical protein
VTETTKPKRRWYQFSLRTLLIAMTLLAIWLGWNIKKVRQRSEYARYLIAKGEDVIPLESAATVAAQHPWSTKRVPWVWRWMGATPIEYIRIHEARGFAQADARVMADLFPEARVYFVSERYEESRVD